MSRAIEEGGDAGVGSLLWPNAHKLDRESSDSSARSHMEISRAGINAISPKPENYGKEDDEVGKEEEETLGHLLRRSGHRHVDPRIKQFWTDDILAKVMTKTYIIGELQRYRRANPALLAASSVETVADDILKHRKKVFAVLALLNKGACIQEVAVEGLVDQNLPLHTDGSPSCPLYRISTDSKAQKIRCFSRPNWDIIHRETFLTSQHAMSPEFLGFDPNGRTPKHGDFRPEVILPIMQEDELHEGGYAVIKKIKLAPTCHDFHNRLRLIKTNDEFALKRLFKKDAAEFQKEVKAGERFNGFARDHLVTLLMSWTFNDEYYLLFPLARCDLEEHWSDPSAAPFNPDMARWMLKQILGITQALAYIHDPSASASPHDSSPSGERGYGRHNDLKPENLLLFDSPDHPRGIILIADLGLATLNSATSRTQSNTKARCGPRYKAPEFNMKGAKIRRSCDVWSLGCVLLEWVCWAFEGNGARMRFLDDLYEPFPSGSQTDLFFVMERRKRGLVAKATSLHKSMYCSQVFHDLLGLIQDRMIVVREEHRISAEDLQSELGKMVERGQRDCNYFDCACEDVRVVEPPLALEAEFFVPKTKRGIVSLLELNKC